MYFNDLTRSTYTRYFFAMNPNDYIQKWATSRYRVQKPTEWILVEFFTGFFPIVTKSFCSIGPKPLLHSYCDIDNQIVKIKLGYAPCACKSLWIMHILDLIFSQRLSEITYIYYVSEINDFVLFDIIAVYFYHLYAFFINITNLISWIGSLH